MTQQEETPLLECRTVVRHYGALAAVDGVDLRVMPGETVGIGGPNGAGKTTFFDLISGFTPVTRGEVLFQGKPITGTAPHKLCLRGMARTFQVTSGFTTMSVWQNVMAAVIYASPSHKPGLLFTRGMRDTTEQALAEYELSEFSNQLVSDIPALARKKLMVATAMVNRPRLLLLDEPVGGLMPAEVDQFIALMRKIRDQGTTIVFIEHVMRFLTAVADRALIMHQGKLIYDGAPGQIGEDSTVRAVYLGTSAHALEAH